MLLRDVRAGRRPGARAAASICSIVVPSVAMRSLHGLLRAVAEGDHGDDGGDADHDAEHREDGAQDVGTERGERDPDDLETHGVGGGARAAGGSRKVSRGPVGLMTSPPTLRVRLETRGGTLGLGWAPRKGSKGKSGSAI